MKVKYDDVEICLTPRFIAALEELMLAELGMMQEQDKFSPECWTWGICEVGDLASLKALSFEFGGEDDKPDVFSESKNVLVRPRDETNSG